MTETAGRLAALDARVAELFDRVRARYPAALACARGCSMCCHQHLTLVPVEMRRILVAVHELAPDAQAAIRARVRSGRDDPRCPLLDDAGGCRVYEARPTICRTHGLVVQVPDEGATRRDVCPLNFTAGPPLSEVDADCVLEVERLNQVLGVIDAMDGEGAGEGAVRARVDLFEALAALLG